MYRAWGLEFGVQDLRQLGLRCWCVRMSSPGLHFGKDFGKVVSWGVGLGGDQAVVEG